VLGCHLHELKYKLIPVIDCGLSARATNEGSTVASCLLQRKFKTITQDKVTITMEIIMGKRIQG